jgi:probable HAF family extracellular repeat protein
VNGLMRLLVCLVVCALPLAPSCASPTYTIVDLGAVGGLHSWAEALNDYGQVVGYARNGADYDRAFLYSGGTITDLGDFGGTRASAYGINNLGQVVGTAWEADGDTLAFLYTGGPLTNLGASAEAMATAGTSTSPV